MNEQMTTDKISIPLGEGRGEKSFSSIEQYNEFIRNEHAFWKWIGGRLEHPLNYLQDFVKTKCINDLLINIDANNVSNHIRILSERQKRWLPIYSFTPEGQFIKHLHDSYGQVIGMFALLHITDLTYNELSVVARQNNHYADLMKIYSTQNAIAINMVLLFKNKQQGTTAYVDSIEAMHKEFTYTLSCVEEKLSQSVDEYNNKINSIIDKHESLYKKTKEKFKRWSERCLAGIKKTRVFAENTFIESKEDIKQAATAYHEQVDLDASVCYWLSRKSTNQRNSFIWLIFGVGGSIALTFILLVEYYAKGGIVGLSSKIAETPDKVGVKTAEQVMALTAGNGMEHLVINMTGAALVVTLMAVIIRVALRQFNTYSHLSLEAEERVTMVKTYLALLNEGKLKSDQDRHLALEALFRTSQTGMIAETSFNSPVDIIVKSLADKAKV
ncbi:hypothetical protein D3C85_882210 [compost metagenome]